MPLIVPNTGELVLLDNIVKTASPNGQQMKLFKNDATISASTVFSDLTEADFTGYAAVDLDRTGWGDSTTDGTGRDSSTYSTDATYQNDGTAAQSIYGYMVVDDDGTGEQLLWVQKFNDPFNIASGGGQLTIRLKLTLKSEN